MDISSSFIGSDVFSFVILPICIFFARICDVSLGTIRIIYLSKGFKTIAPLIGFFEILIWLLAITQIMQNLDNVVCYLAYAGGYALGNFVGMSIEERLAIGNIVIEIITQKNADDLIQYFKSIGCRFTTVDGHGAIGPVKIIYSVIDRKNLSNVVNIVKMFNPNAFYTVEDVKFVHEVVTPFNGESRHNRYQKKLFRLLKKTK
ncbi:MAG TPA: DUF2179 domain-containing protein [Halobacteria archaeon]|nr:DUF2179 domain-containing protein [Halobacteria archaeon]